jgi:hypothetical protein
VASEVIEIFFLREHVGLRFFFAPGIALQENGPIYLCGKLGAALRISRIGFALPPLLRGRGESGCETNEKNCQRAKNTRAVSSAPFITPLRTLKPTHPLTSLLARASRAKRRL